LAGGTGDLAETPRRGGSCAAGHFEQGPAGTKAAADLLVEFSSEDLTRAVESDLALRGQIKDVWLPWTAV